MIKNLTDTFIEGLLQKARDIPSPVLGQAKKCLLDYTGVVVGGAHYLQQQYSNFFSTLTQEEGKCSVFGTKYKTTLFNASFLNGFSAHVLELDDGHRMGMVHLGASIISAVLAVAEHYGLEPNEILRGIVIGYEAAIRCACSLQPNHKIRGYHVSGTCGVIGAAFATAFAKNYNFDQLKSTLSCAVTSAAGLLEIQEEASDLKPYNLGRAAMDGVVAAKIGEMAMSAPDDILGGKRGFLSVLTGTPEPRHFKDFTGKDYCIEHIYQKIYASCRHCHPAIEAAILILKDLDFKYDLTEEIEAIEVHTYKLAIEGHNHTEIKSLSSAKLSIPYSVALALVKGNLGYDEIKETNLIDEKILTLTKKVSVIEDDSLTAKSPMARGARVVIRLKSGDLFEKYVLYPRGEPENPLCYEDIQEKVNKLMGDYQNSFLMRLIGENDLLMCSHESNSA